MHLCTGFSSENYSSKGSDKMKFYEVTSSFYNNGRAIAALTNIVEADEPPQNVIKSLKRCDVYIDYFKNKKAAERLDTINTLILTPTGEEFKQAKLNLNHWKSCDNLSRAEYFNQSKIKALVAPVKKVKKW